MQPIIRKTVLFLRILLAHGFKHTSTAPAFAGSVRQAQQSLGHKVPLVLICQFAKAFALASLCQPYSLLKLLMLVYFTILFSVLSTLFCTCIGKNGIKNAIFIKFQQKRPKSNAPFGPKLYE